jgi:membrane associated rhomboid family serine protease
VLSGAGRLWPRSLLGSSYMAPPIRELTLGRLRVPAVIVGLILAIALLSIAGAVGGRNGADWIGAGSVLFVPEVWRGQVWRLFTWALCEFGPIALLFACLTLYWFGSDLARRWGTWRFLGFYFGIATAAAAVTCLLALFWTALQGIPYAGSWAVLDAIVIAWGLLHPGRELRFWGVLRLTGRHLVWLTFGLTVLFALFYGLSSFIPHFVAELLVWGWLGPLPGLLRGRRQANLEKRARDFDLNKWIEKDRRR